MSQSKARGVNLHRDGNGMLPVKSCSKLWGINKQCLPTRHYCMFEDTASVIKIDGKQVCGASFCTVCVENASLEGTTLCPYHSPKSTHYRINPWISFVENDNQIKSLHLKDGIIATREKHVTYKMKINSQCCCTKKDAQSCFRRTIGFVKCDNPNRKVPLHFECFQLLILSKYDGKFICGKNNNEIESILIASGKRCYNIMKKESTLTNIKQIKEPSKPKENPRPKQMGKASWSNDGTGTIFGRIS